MRIVFLPKELSWLERVTANMVALTRKNKADRALIRAVNRIRYKFAPNSHTVFLTQKERELLSQVAQARISTLSSTPYMSDEIDVVESVKRKLTKVTDGKDS